MLLAALGIGLLTHNLTFIGQHLQQFCCVTSDPLLQRKRDVGTFCCFSNQRIVLAEFRHILWSQFFAALRLTLYSRGKRTLVFFCCFSNQRIVLAEFRQMLWYQYFRYWYAAFSTYKKYISLQIETFSFLTFFLIFTLFQNAVRLQKDPTFVMAYDALQKTA